MADSLEEQPYFHVQRHIIRETYSVCPECNNRITATVFEREGKVWMVKNCSVHGECEELYFGSYRMYRKFERYENDGRGVENPNVSGDWVCPQSCGLCSGHLSHSALANLVVTNRCDLSCWYCFFYARRGEGGGYVYEPTLDQIRAMIKTLRAERPVPGNALQITGGEPTSREDLVEIIRVIKEEGVDHVQLNTNGIVLAKDPTLAKKVRRAGVNAVYMSFDGLTPRTNPKNHWEAPIAMNNCREAGLGIVLVPTVIRGVNDHELGGIMRFGFDNIDVIRSVNFQPVSLTGRVRPSGAKLRSSRCL